MSLNVIDVLALAALALLLGTLVHRIFPWTEKYSLPRSVLGGLVMAALLAAAEWVFQIKLELNMAAQTPLMVAFFASLGFGASWQALRAGGIKVVYFFGLCIGLLVIQNIVGIGTAYALGQHPLFGVITSSVSMVGGPGTALAFAPVFVENGIPEAATIGITAAMAGILVAGLVGGPVATWLIEKEKLNPDESLQTRGFRNSNLLGLNYSYAEISANIRIHIILLLVVMALGAYVAGWIASIGVTFPIYIGSMIVAAIFRNFDDRFGWIKINEAFLESLASVALSLFIAMSLMSLQWGQLFELAGPILIALIVQTILVVGLCLTFIYRAYGRNYESAVLAGGMIGFMMGTTANAMANLESITKKYGPAPFAYFIIPLVGACFIDFANAAVIALMINIFGN